MTQDSRLAEEIALKEHIAELKRLTELVLRFDLLGEQTDMTGENFAQLFPLLGILGDAKVHLNDIRHLDKRLIAGEQDKIVEGDLVACCLEFLYRFKNLRAGLYRFENLHHDGIGGEELRRPVEQIFLRKIDEALFFRDEFFHAEFEHRVHHHALRRDIAVEIGVKGVFQTAAE